MKSIREIVEQVQIDLATNLNSWIENSQREGETWFNALSFHDDAPRVESDRLYMGIYMASPSGSVFSATGKDSSIDITLDCFLDDKRENSSVPEKYLSAVVDYLNRREYGVSSMAYSAVTLRTDLGAPVNGFAVAIKVTTYDIDMDIL